MLIILFIGIFFLRIFRGFWGFKVFFGDFMLLIEFFLLGVIFIFILFLFSLLIIILGIFVNVIYNYKDNYFK